MRLAILISGQGSNMQALALACQRGQIDAQAIRVFSDRADATGLALAASLGCASEAIPAHDYPTRAAFEQALERSLVKFAPATIALAGFMRVLSGEFVARRLGQMVNIHPSLLPRHKGLHTHRKVLQAGDSQHGATVHFVTPELDGGPAILQARLAVAPQEDEAQLSARVQACEHIIYPRVVGWLSRGQLCLRDGMPELNGERMHQPLVEDF